MLIVTATNVTKLTAKKTSKPVLSRKDGTADYDVWLGINTHCLWRGVVTGHIRAQGASVLLRHIADAIDAHPRSEPARKKA